MQTVRARIGRRFGMSMLVAGLALVVAGETRAQPTGSKTPASSRPAGIDARHFANLAYRSIGPAIMGGRCTDVEGVPGSPEVAYVGSASGGVWKTTNAGTTWKPIFDSQRVASIGDLALEPGNPEVVYVGTGEGNPRNSASFGDGVYKSTDGGASWRHLGLRDIERVTRIAVSPRDPRQVYVAALGKVFGPHPERGVYRSGDGGETWHKTLYLDERHGASDLDVDPQNPNVLYAGMWLFERKPWTHTSGSEKGGLFKSVDGGRTWKKLEKGLPKLLGRIGVKVAPSNPRVVYVMTEAKDGTLYRSDDAGESFSLATSAVDVIDRGFYFTDLRVDPVDENRVYAIAGSLRVSIDAGKSWRLISKRTHGDYHGLWIDPQRPSRIWQVQDGGVAVSYDRGETWDYLNNFAVAQFYQLYADNREPFYYVGGGLQDNSTWYGPGRTREPAGILSDDWRQVSGGDGYWAAVHPDDPELFLSEYQGGGIVRTDMKTREQIDVSPQPRRNDGGPVGELKYRFSWNSPIVPSPHDGRTVYFTGNVVFRSKDFGLNWDVISPDLTTNDAHKQKSAGGPVWLENTTAEYHCTIVSFAESPAQKGVLWAGSDDGKIHVSRDDGATWVDVTANLAGLGASPVVSHLEPARRDAGTAYAAFDRHMFDDFRPYVFKTTDFGKTWTNVTGNLPVTAHVFVVREDPRNSALIYAGTELGLYASWSGGREWTRLHLKDLPAAAVHEVIVHPRDNDLILATHGRGIYIFDDATPIQAMSAELTARTAHLFDVRPALRFTMMSTRYGIGDKVFRGQNPPYGALVTYWLKDELAAGAPLRLEVLDGQGGVVRELRDLPRGAGLQRVVWDLAGEPPRPRADKKPEPFDPETDFGGPARGPRVLPGAYTLRLTAGSETLTRPVEVRLDPTLRVEAAGLAGQHSLATRLRDRISIVNDALRGLDAVKSQLEDRKKTWPAQTSDAVKGEVVRAVDQELERLARVADAIAKPSGKTYYSEGPRLAERLDSLFSGIDGSANGVVTRPQAELFEELLRESNAAIESYNGYLETIAAANRMLAERKLPAIAAPARIDLP